MATERARDENSADADHSAALRMRAIWRPGPRTRAWDDLWRWLLADDGANEASRDSLKARDP